MRSTSVAWFWDDDGLAGPHVAHPFLQPAFEMQAADDPAGDDGDGHAENEIDQRHLPADQREQQAERDLVDHRRRDQEGKGHAERHAGRYEADEQRHGRAGAEGREDAERRRRDIAEALAPPGQHGAGAFGRKEAAHDAHAEDDQRQQHQHFRRVEDEEARGFLEMAARRQRAACRQSMPRNLPAANRAQTTGQARRGSRPIHRAEDRAGIKRWRSFDAHAALLSAFGKAVDDRVDDGDDCWRQGRIAAITHPLRVAPVDDQPGGLEGGHMARHARLAGVDLLHQFADAMLFAVPQQAKRGEAGGFGQGGKERNDILHERINMS